MVAIYKYNYMCVLNISLQNLIHMAVAQFCPKVSHEVAILEDFFKLTSGEENTTENTLINIIPWFDDCNWLCNIHFIEIYTVYCLNISILYMLKPVALVLVALVVL